MEEFVTVEYTMGETLIVVRIDQTVKDKRIAIEEAKRALEIWLIRNR
jgi:hypothetical protein